MTEDYFYDYTLYLSQIRGGDARLNLYVFVYYDRLGYVVYGLSEIGEDYCDNLFNYDHLLGLNDDIQRFTQRSNIDLSESLDFSGSVNKNYSYLLNNSSKSNYYYRISNISQLNLYNNNIKKLLNCYEDLNLSNHLNYYYKFNGDRSFSWIEFNNFLKIIKNKS